VAGALVACVSFARAQDESPVTPVVETQIGVAGLEEPLLEGEFTRQSPWLGVAAGVSWRLGSSWSLKSTVGVGTFAHGDTSSPGLIDHYVPNSFGGWDSVPIGEGKAEHVRQTAILLRLEPALALGDVVWLRAGAGAGMVASSFEADFCASQSDSAFAYSLIVGTDIQLGSNWVALASVEALRAPLMYCDNGYPDYPPDYPSSPPNVHGRTVNNDDEHTLILRFGLGYSFR
jgi:opacity protein-like surface antigen